MAPKRRACLTAACTSSRPNVSRSRRTCHVLPASGTAPSSRCGWPAHSQTAPSRRATAQTPARRTRPRRARSAMPWRTDAAGPCLPSGCARARTRAAQACGAVGERRQESEAARSGVTACASSATVTGPHSTGRRCAHASGSRRTQGRGGDPTPLRVWFRHRSVPDPDCLPLANCAQKGLEGPRVDAPAGGWHYPEVRRLSDLRPDRPVGDEMQVGEVAVRVLDVEG